MSGIFVALNLAFATMEAERGSFGWLFWLSVASLLLNFANLVRE